jgi:hypothetical protein
MHVIERCRAEAYGPPHRELADDRGREVNLADAQLAKG